MTSVIESESVSNYVLPAVGIVPSMFLGGAEIEPNVPAQGVYNAVYNQSLIRDVASRIGEIQGLLRRISPSPTGVTFVEAPSDADYSDVYTRRNVKVTVFEDNSVPDLYDDEPDIWL